MRRFLAFLGVAGVTVVIAAAGLWWAACTLDAPSTLAAPLVYRVAPHARFSQVAADLERQQAIAHSWIWIVHARATGMETRIKAGEYLLAPHSAPRDILRKLVAGEVLLHTLTIVEGWRFQDLRDAIHKTPAIASTPLNDAALMARVGSPAESAEGQFLPETYKFPAGTSEIEILNKAHQALVTLLGMAWASRDERLPLHSAQELLTLASIVEKETALPAERQKIAGVYAQRLLQGMRLQADPTVIYGLGARYDGNLRSVDLHTDGPYNTYMRAGLPPTPICLPGAASIRAAAHPEMNGALYFVATGRGDGSHTFSQTLDEHNRAVAQFLQRTRAGEGMHGASGQ